ncbi:CBS domain-containing protein [Oceanihabitans sediminis]|uniref:CBS domain-containing protein n=1 Tax=Oceanihabitans sediminis TaxID=1812012 RepID=UPI00299D3E6F|nr:CBS domain-containing protein [Oceanihabitans sediminis]MDX1774025.1 CBS domain-containing protein [Oceanihabitans sediminis]
MTNSERFIDIYNKIDKYLKKIEAYDSYVNFAQKVKNSNSKVIQRFKDELLSFGELRNAIVHNPRIGNKYIAEPHESTVLRIEKIYESITTPLKVIPKFQFDVIGANQSDYINDILIEMNKMSFSQFPVYDDNGCVVELISTNTISRWLSSQLEEKGTVLIEGVKVADLLTEIEFKGNYKFVSRNTSIYDAYELFISHINDKQRNLDAVFITQNGKSTEKLLGLITIEDIASLI